MLKTIELCEGCEKEYHRAYRTDDDVLLCADCFVELLRSELNRRKAKLDDYEQTLRIIMFATTLPPMVLNDNEGFYRRELQRCIGDAARVLHKHKQESLDVKPIP